MSQSELLNAIVAKKASIIKQQSSFTLQVLQQHTETNRTEYSNPS